MHIPGLVMGSVGLEMLVALFVGRLPCHGDAAATPSSHSSSPAQIALARGLNATHGKEGV